MKFQLYSQPSFTQASKWQRQSQSKTRLGDKITPPLLEETGDVLMSISPLVIAIGERCPQGHHHTRQQPLAAFCHLDLWRL